MFDDRVKYLELEKNVNLFSEKMCLSTINNSAKLNCTWPYWNGFPSGPGVG
jgi:hypothetical protein